MKDSALHSLAEKRQEMTHFGAFNDLEHLTRLNRTQPTAFGMWFALNMRCNINLLTGGSHDLI